MQGKIQEQLFPADAEVILERLPKRIQTALITRAAEVDCLLRKLLKWRSPVSSTQKH